MESVCWQFYQIIHRSVTISINNSQSIQDIPKPSYISSVLCSRYRFNFCKNQTRIKVLLPLTNKLQIISGSLSCVCVIKASPYPSGALIRHQTRPKDSQLYHIIVFDQSCLLQILTQA